jgi:hypothetical protein
VPNKGFAVRNDVQKREDITMNKQPSTFMRARAARDARTKLLKKFMLRMVIIGAVSATAVALSDPAFSQQGQFGTAAEASAMLEKAVVAVKADKAKALAMFNNGEGAFKERDLYLFCFNIMGGIITAGPPAVLGTDVRTLMDPTGKAVGQDLFNAPREGTMAISYMAPRPGADNTPVRKVSFVARAGDQGCGVGYYE